MDLCAGFSGNRQGCSACTLACPHGAVTRGKKSIEIDSETCQRCGACVAACPTGALERRFSTDQDLMMVFAEALEEVAGSRPVIQLQCMHHDQQGVISRVSVSADLAVFQVPSVHLFSEAHLLGIIAMGFRAVMLSPCSRCESERGLQAPQRVMDLTNRLLQAWGVPGGERVFFLRSGEKYNGESRILPNFGENRWSPSSKHGVFQRQWLKELLLYFAGHSQSAVPLLETDPFAEIHVKESGCTLCGSCMGTCPTQALELPQGGDLTFKAVDCVACGLCVSSCPEKVMTLERKLPMLPQAFEKRTLKKSEWVNCPSCGVVTYSREYIARIETLLSKSSFYQTPERKELLKMCEPCKSAAAT